MATSSPGAVPVLTDGVVRLRAHRADDAAGLIAFANDPRSMRWIPLPHPYGPQQAGEFLQHTRANWAADPVHPTWAIEVDGRFAGGINLHPRGPGGYEVGYSAHPDARGRGVVGRAARLACDYAFSQLGARTVTWRAARGNFASWRVAWSAGFTFDAVVPAMHHDTLYEHLDGLWIGHRHADEPATPRRPWWEPAELTGDRVRLRAWRDDDAPTDSPADDVRLTAQELPTPDCFADWLLDRRTEQAIGRAVNWCIADAATDEALGHLQIGRLDEEFIHRTGAVAYWLLPSARRRGLLQEALDLAVPHAFTPRTDIAGTTGLGLRRLQAGIDSRPQPSRRALLRAGFRFWGAEREVLGYGGDTGHDAESFELLATDDRDAQRITPLEVPELRTERLLLRAWTEADAPGPDQVTDADARRFMANELPTAATFPASLLRREQGADRGTSVTWCITEAATGAVLGNIGLFAIGDGAAGSAGLGYWLWQTARGHGYAGEAAAAVLAHARGPMGLTRLHAETDLDNIPSQRVLLRLGFRQWGADHAAYTNADGSVTDGAYFELLPDAAASTADLPAVIHGDGVRLRPLRRDDVDRAWEASVDPAYVCWLDGDANLTRERTRDWIARVRPATAREQRWAITGPDSDEFAGCITVQGVEPRTGAGEIGYWLHPDARGRGLATRAVRALVDHAFSPAGLDLRRLSLNVADGNEASLRVARASGFTPSGRDRAAEPLGDGRVVDLLRFERLREN